MGTLGVPSFFEGAQNTRHPGGIPAGSSNGSVRFIKDTIAPVIRIGPNTIQGGEVLSSDGC